MAGLLVHRAQRVFVATPAWEVMLRPLLPQGRTTEWLPVPSNLPETANHAAVAAIRTAAIPNGGVLLGHFGTYGYSIASLLQGLLPPLLGSRPERRGILIGRNSHRFVEELCYRHPGLTGRVLATGGLAAQDLADHLAACDLLVQPYSEGVTTRRASLMGGLCLGVPVVTNRGVMTEPIWKKSGAVALVEDTTGPTFLHAVEELLASTSERKRLRLAGVHFYREWFALERTVAVLRGKPITPDGIS
jgi:glycosyltransferase involved in cell wall biosynthesis